MIKNIGFKIDLGIIKSRKKLIIHGTLLFTLLVGLISLILPKEYEGEVTLLILKPSLMLTESSLKRQFSFLTYGKIAKNKSVLNKVMKHFELDKDPYNLSFNEFEKKRVVINQSYRTNIVKLKVTLPDPYLAQTVSRAIAKCIIQVNEELNKSELERLNSLSIGQLEEAKENLEKTGSKLSEFKRDSHVKDLRKELEISLKEKEKTRLTELYNIDALINEKRAQIKVLDETLNPIIVRSSRNITPEMKQSELSLTMQSAKLAGLLAKRKTFLLKTKQNQIHINNIQQKLSEQESRLEKLQMDYNLAKTIYSKTTEKLEELKIFVPSSYLDIKLLDPGIVPEKASSPIVILNTIVGFILGLHLMVGLAYYLEYADRLQAKEQQND